MIFQYGRELVLIQWWVSKLYWKHIFFLIIFPVCNNNLIWFSKFYIGQCVWYVKRIRQIPNAINIIVLRTNSNLGKCWVWVSAIIASCRRCSNGYIITWILHQFFMFYNKMKLVAGYNNDSPFLPLYPSPPLLLDE